MFERGEAGHTVHVGDKLREFLVTPNNQNLWTTITTEMTHANNHDALRIEAFTTGR